MKKFFAPFILAVCFTLLSATPATNSGLNPDRDDFLIIRFKPLDPKPDTRISFSVNDYGHGKSYFWKFGDSTDQVITQGPSCSHTYSKPGTYMVRVHTNGGKMATEMVMVSK